MTPISISRRSLLVAGSAIALTGLRGDVGARRPNALERLAARPGARIPLLYVDADPGAPLAAAAGSVVVAAATLPSGERALEGRAIAVDVAGLTEGGSGSASRAVLDALVLAADGPDQAVPFYAFTHRPGSTSAPARLFTVGSSAPALGLTLDLDGSSATSVFTTRREPGLDRLRSGWYLIDLRPAGGPVPARLPAAGDPGWGGLPSLALAVSAT